MEEQGRMQRVNELLFEAIGSILRKYWSQQGLGITLTKVICAPDLTSARVHYSVLNDDQEAGRKFFNDIKAQLSQRIAHAVTFKRHPKLKFIYDDSLKNMAAVDRILNGIEAPVAAPKAKKAKRTRKEPTAEDKAVKKVKRIRKSDVAD